MIRGFYFIYQLFFLPHVLLFYSSKKQSQIIDDLYCKSNKSESNLSTINDLTLELAKNKFFRTLFYFRINNTFSKILRFFYPRDIRFTIDINTKIGGGVILAHPYSTIINAEKVGRNLYINQLVTVGEKDGNKPIIGNNVKLYTNCTIIGGISIGNNCVIGAGSVVTKDIPDNSVVVGNPGIVIKKLKI